jgi:hypothetical protein
MNLGHAGCLPRKKKAAYRQTDMDEPPSCFPLTLEIKEHLRAGLDVFLMLLKGYGCHYETRAQVMVRC